MIEGWNSHYRLKPVVEGDFDYYKISFQLVKIRPSTTIPIKTTGKNSEYEIVTILENNPHLTLREVGEHVGLSEEGVRYHIRNLKVTGKIERVGSSKSGK